MNGFGYIVMYAWPAVIVLLFLSVPTRWAVLLTILIATLALPVVEIRIEGLPNYHKFSSANVGALIGAILREPTRLTAFRPRLVDLPMLVLCLCPLPSGLTNGLGLYGSLSATASQIIIWGLPYLLGRLFFQDLLALRDMAVALLVGGLVCVPLCLYEIRMSPHLHDYVYGLHAHKWVQTKRFGGWRPTLFMVHGLAVGFWMAASTLVATWFWVSGTLRTVWRMSIPMAVVVPGMLVTTVLCKSIGAIGLMIAGVGALLASRSLRTATLFVALMLLPGTYVIVRSTGAWSGGALVDAVGRVLPQKVGSLSVRLEAENLLVAKALERPLFGWSAGGRSRVRDHRGRDLAVTDGLWVVTLGRHGLVGLVAMISVLLVPPLLLVIHYPPSTWASPLVASAAVLALIVALFAIDSLLNAMYNPLWVLAAGALCCLPEHAPIRQRVVAPVTSATARPVPLQRLGGLR